MAERKTLKKSTKPAAAVMLSASHLVTARRPAGVSLMAGPFSRTTLYARLALLTPTTHPTRVG
jgi:hypothetical protein